MVSERNVHILFCRHVWAELSLLFWTFLSGTFFPGEGGGGGMHVHPVHLAWMRKPISICSLDCTDNYDVAEIKGKLVGYLKCAQFQCNWFRLHSGPRPIVDHFRRSHPLCEHSYFINTSTGISRACISF